MEDIKRRLLFNNTAIKVQVSEMNNMQGSTSTTFICKLCYLFSLFVNNSCSILGSKYLTPYNIEQLLNIIVWCVSQVFHAGSKYV